MVRTRIAPSPTGEGLHIGNLYTGLINYAIAKKNNGKFIIRIEDTDRERFIGGSEQKILESLKRLNLVYDEGPDIGGSFAPYRQSERLNIYHSHARQLIESGHAEFAYYPKDLAGKKKDYKSKEEQDVIPDQPAQNPPNTIEEMIKRTDWVVRMKIPKDQKVVVKDVIHGDIEFQTNDLSSQVLIKSDGYPTYHLGVVVDDHLMEISHVIRAEEWISSTPKHVLLYKAFGWDLPIFAHVPILRNPDHSKLSKRKNPVWVSWYLEQGFLPEAILNFVALLGWSYPDEREIFSLEEFVDKFDLKDLKPVGPVFDIKKLEWMNGEYIRQLSAEQLSEKLKAQSEKFADEKMFRKFVELAQTRMKTLNEFARLTQPFVSNVQKDLTEDEKQIEKKLAEKLSQIKDWNVQNVLDTIKEVLSSENTNMKIVYKITTGSESGLPIADVFQLLGKEKTLLLLVKSLD